MKLITEIFKTDIKKIFKNWVALIVVIGICFLPALYAWFNIGANMDPYSNTDQVKVAVACLDQGTTAKSIGHVNAGASIIKELKHNKKLDWQFVSRNKAMSGVESGRYYAAIIIPKEFSKDLLSFLSGDIQRPEMLYYVNEKENAIAPKITGTGATTLQLKINETFKAIVAGTVVRDLDNYIDTVTGELNNASNRISSDLDKTVGILNGYQTAINSFRGSYSKNQQLINSSRRLASSIDGASDSVNNNLQKNSQIIGETRNDINGLRDQINRTTTGTAAEELGQEMTGRLDKMTDALNSADSLTLMSQGVVSTVSPTMRQTNSMLTGLQSGLKSTDKSMKDMSEALEITQKRLLATRDELNAISSSQAFDKLAKIRGADAKDAAEFMASPVELKSEAIYPVKNYGSGMTPFYTMLAIWVSGLILIAIFKLEVSPEELNSMPESVSTTQAYFGRSIMFMILGLIQSMIICLGDIYIMRVQCLHPVAFICAGLLSGLVFVNLIYALAITFKHIGKAIAVILVILQIPGSSGTYPIELTGHFFQKIHPLLPFTYGVSALRESIAGFYGWTYFKNLAVLLLFLAVALFIGLVLKPMLMNFNHTFDTRLAETGFMAGVENTETSENVRVKNIVRVLSSDKKAREGLIGRLEKFENTYEVRKSRGLKLMIIVPLILLVLMFVLPQKMLMLTLWIITIIGFATYLMWLEHLHKSLIDQNDIDEQLRRGEASGNE